MSCSLRDLLALNPKPKTLNMGMLQETSTFFEGEFVGPGEGRGGAWVDPSATIFQLLVPSTGFRV